MADTGDNMKYRQKKAAEYFVGKAAGNMEKAAVMAGYSKRYARGNAYKIFEIPEVINRSSSASISSWASKPLPLYVRMYLSAFFLIRTTG